MKTLIVDTPAGTQEAITVYDGGGYFDAKLVLWDTETDGPIPDELSGAVGWLEKSDGKLVPSAAKKAAYDARKAATDAKEAERMARKERLKAHNAPGANSIAALRTIVADMLDEMRGT